MTTTDTFYKADMRLPIFCTLFPRYAYIFCSPLRIYSYAISFEDFETSPNRPPLDKNECYYEMSVTHIFLVTKTALRIYF